MKATTNREGLLTAFTVVAGVVPARSPKQILENVKLEIGEGQEATLSGTDLDVGIRYRVSGATAIQPGQSVIPCAKVIAILREMPDETIEIDSSGNVVTLRGSTSRFELNSADPLQFPEVITSDAPLPCRIKSSVLETMIKRTVFAAAQENSRYALNSVLFEVDGSVARMVATDGKRLAIMPGPVTCDEPPPRGTYLIPPKTLHLALKVLVDPEEEVGFSLREGEFLLRTTKVTVHSRLTEGRFPQYQDVIPAAGKIQIPLATAPFATAVRQARIVTDKNSKGVDFLFDQGNLTLNSLGSEVGQSTVRMPISYDGKAIQVTFDPQFLIDALRVVDPDGEIQLHMSDGGKASVLRSPDEYAYVVMPLTRDST